MKPLIVLTGPTAVGKTSLSIALAKLIHGEIISADSMQVYRYMDIGTAKIKSSEMQGVPHYLIDEFDPDEEFNVTIFQKRAKECMEKIWEKGKIPILVGGTGFYIQSVLYDIDFTEDQNDYQYRHQLEKIAREQGANFLHQKLAEVDKKSAESIHANNVKKVIRALEYYHLTNRRISEHNEQQRQKKSPYAFAYFVLDLPREILYQRINQRVDQMMDEGLVDEVRMLMQKGYQRGSVAMEGLGYKEIIAYLEGECSLEEAVNIIKRDTRHFAKRQCTWFRREKDVITIDKSTVSDELMLLPQFIEVLKEKEIPVETRKENE